MNPSFFNEKTLKYLLQDLICCLNLSKDKMFGSFLTDETDRLFLRNQLLKQIQTHRSLSESEKSNLLNLSHPPQIKGLCVSISHTHKCAGFVFGPIPLGLDLELVSRIKNFHILFVKSDSESKDPYIWPLKESGFKCLQSHLIEQDFKKPQNLAQMKNWSFELENKKKSFLSKNCIAFKSLKTDSIVIKSLCLRTDDIFIALTGAKSRK